jgi:hypothetical protein
MFYLWTNSRRLLRRGEAWVIFAVSMPVCRKAGGSYGMAFGYHSALRWLDKVFGHDCLHHLAHAASPCGFVRSRAVLRFWRVNFSLRSFRKFPRCKCRLFVCFTCVSTFGGSCAGDLWVNALSRKCPPIPKGVAGHTQSWSLFHFLIMPPVCLQSGGYCG